MEAKMYAMPEAVFWDEAYQRLYDEVRGIFSKAGHLPVKFDEETGEVYYEWDGIDSGAYGTLIYESDILEFLHRNWKPLMFASASDFFGSSVDSDEEVWPPARKAEYLVELALQEAVMQFEENSRKMERKQNGQ